MVKILIHFHIFIFSVILIFWIFCSTANTYFCFWSFVKRLVFPWFSAAFRQLNGILSADFRGYFIYSVFTKCNDVSCLYWYLIGIFPHTTKNIVFICHTDLPTLRTGKCNHEHVGLNAVTIIIYIFVLHLCISIYNYILLIVNIRPTHNLYKSELMPNREFQIKIGAE